MTVVNTLRRRFQLATARSKERGHVMNTTAVLDDLSSSKDPHLGNPYLAARKEWDERYGSLIKRAQNWRLAAMLALLVAIAEAVVILGVATRPKTVPYVVAVDSLGRVVASGP